METISTKMSSWLSYNSITQRIVSGHFQSIDSSFVELSRGESSTNVHGGHFVTIDSADFQASSGQFDGLSETWRTVLSRSAVEVDSFEFDAHLFDFMHSGVDFLVGADVISKFSRELGCKVVAFLFLDGDSPEDAHVGGNLFDFDELVDGVCSCVLHTVVLSPLEIALVFDWVRVNDWVSVCTNIHHWFKLSPGSAVESSSFPLQIVEQGEGGVGFDGVVGSDPGECLLPGWQLADGLLLVIDQAAGLEVMAAEDWADLGCLLVVEDSVVVPLKEVDGVGLWVVEDEPVTPCEATPRDSLKQCA